MFINIITTMYSEKKLNKNTVEQEINKQKDIRIYNIYTYKFTFEC